MKKMLCHTPISIKENIYPIPERINVLSKIGRILILFLL